LESVSSKRSGFELVRLRAGQRLGFHSKPQNSNIPLFPRNRYNRNPITLPFLKIGFLITIVSFVTEYPTDTIDPFVNIATSGMASIDGLVDMAAQIVIIVTGLKSGGTITIVISHPISKIRHNRYLSCIPDATNW
jgi:hypothetical protein